MVSRENDGSFLSKLSWPVWIFGIVIGVILLASFMPHHDVIPVRAMAVERGVIRSLVSTNGKVEPVQNFEAHAPVGTTVKRLLVKEGDHVKKGQLLAQLDDAAAQTQAAQAIEQLKTAQAGVSVVKSGGNQEEVLTLNSDLAKARSARDTAKRNLDALKLLQQNGAASSGEVQQAANTLASADADAKLLEQKQRERYSAPEIAQSAARESGAKSAYAAAEDVLRQLNIRAPFDGVVYSIVPRQGAYVNPGDLILQEADLSKVLVRAYVDEPDVGRLKHGQLIEATWDALPGRIWEGTVADVPSAVKMHGTRNIGEATCVVSNSDYKLLPNVNVGVNIVVGEDTNALVLPREALRQDEQGSYVLQILDNKLIRRNVQTLITNLTQVEISSGLTQDALVAVSSNNSKPLKDGSTIKVVR